MTRNQPDVASLTTRAPLIVALDDVVLRKVVRALAKLDELRFQTGQRGESVAGTARALVLDLRDDTVFPPVESSRKGICLASHAPVTIQVIKIKTWRCVAPPVLGNDFPLLRLAVRGHRSCRAWRSGRATRLDAPGEQSCRHKKEGQTGELTQGALIDVDSA